MSAEAALLATKDEVASRGEYLFDVPIWLHKRLLRCLYDSRDAPAALLVANLAMTSFPLGVLILLCCKSHLLCAAFLVGNYILYLQRFMLTLHITEHRPLFKRECSWMNFFLPYIVCVLFGVPFGLYRPHHVVMHHVEDNHSPWDLSSTEPYQRDNLLHFLRYWVRHAIGAWVELPLYCVRRGRLQLAVHTAGAMAAFWGTTALVWRINPVGVMWVLVGPFFLSSFIIMFGNWSQHIFVVPGGASNGYGMAYNCLNCPDNRLTYNDGYHILHHLNSRLHWCQMPRQFIETLALHDENDALSFRGIGFFDIGLAVFTGRIGWLADHIVPCGDRQARRTREEWMALLRERLKPVVRVKN